MSSRISSAAMLPRVGQAGKPFINAHAQRPPRSGFVQVGIWEIERDRLPEADFSGVSYGHVYGMPVYLARGFPRPGNALISVKIPSSGASGMKKLTRAKEWFDNEDFWRTTFPFMFPESRFTAASETVEKVLTLTKLRGRTALDLCCGPGRCSIALAKRGFSVTGVDRTKYLLDRARARARAAKVDVEWIRQDMRDFVRPEAYHLALSTFTSFGFFSSRHEDTAVLANVFSSLRRGGVFFIEMMGKEILAKSYLPVSAETLPDGSILVERHNIVDDWTRIVNEWTVIQDGIAKGFTLQLNLYSGQELRHKMEHVGFVDVKLYGNVDGAPYGPEAKRLIAIGWKPQQP